MSSNTTISSAKIGQVFFSVAIILFAIGVCVYDYLSKMNESTAVSSQPEIKVVELELVDADPIAEPEVVADSEPVVSLRVGQTKEDVLKILGEPSGKISMGGRSRWIYKGMPIEFVDGKLVEPTEELQGIVFERAEALEEMSAALPDELIVEKSSEEPMVELNDELHSELVEPSADELVEVSVDEMLSAEPVTNNVSADLSLESMVNALKTSTVDSASDEAM